MHFEGENVAFEQLQTTTPSSTKFISHTTICTYIDYKKPQHLSATFLFHNNDSLKVKGIYINKSHLCFSSLLFLKSYYVMTLKPTATNLTLTIGAQNRRLTNSCLLSLY